MAWNGEESKAQTRSKVKAMIFEEIKKSSDDNLKAILALMYGSLEYTDEAISRIEAKIDALRTDEVALKKVVLNGYNDKHHSHHEWLDRRIAHDKYYEDLIAKSIPAIEWIDKFREQSKEFKPVYEWAKTTMIADQESRKDKKFIILKFIGGAASHVGTAIATILMAYILWGPK